MKLDLRPLLAGDRLLEFDYELAPDIDSEDTASFLYGVSFPSPMKVVGDITNTAGYMRMHISATIDYSAKCARCLKDISGKFILNFNRTVANSGTLQDEDNDDYVIMKNGKLDIDRELVEEMLLEFPSKFLCEEECAGLCPKCGKNLNFGPCDCPKKKEIDPRLAILQKLLENE